MIYSHHLLSIVVPFHMSFLNFQKNISSDKWVKLGQNHHWSNLLLEEESFPSCLSQTYFPLLVIKRTVCDKFILARIYT